MPTLQQHVTQARRNEELSRSIESSHPDWAVTTLFYAALHYVKAFSHVHPPMRSAGAATISHDAVISALGQQAPRIHRQYRRLFDGSLDARYQCQVFSQREVDAFRDGDFSAIKTYVHKYLPSDM